MEKVNQVNRLVKCLNNILALIEDGDLVRNTDNDNDIKYFLKQGIRITQTLKEAQEAIDENNQ
jgi:hypothetical protein